MTGAAGLVVAAIGAIVVVVGLADLFVTVFNYDGFTFLAGRVQRGTSALLRTTGRFLPRRVFHRRRTLVTTQVSEALCYDDVA